MTKKQKQNVRKWIKALRSGKFKQTTGELFRTKENAALHYKNEGYCCLGVARNVFKNTSCPLNAVKGGGMLTEQSFERTFGTNLSQGKLATLNDKGSSFEEIADYIEGQVANFS